jgi:HD-like signal output (HDOD) protein|tara:strand:+ start:106732 stop:107637 length:906 start_codon:yes stop_codon:yes gene_type:complete
MSETAVTTPYTDEEIEARINAIPRLASLRSISKALTELLNAEYSLTAQIAEIIRRDPSLTSRLLRLVNSVFFGAKQKVASIEEAVLYLGVRQIRELALATPVIEDFEAMGATKTQFDWSLLWKQSIGAALLTREILNNTDTAYEDDTDYLVGLLHKVGKIAMASAFPEEFSNIHAETYRTDLDLRMRERELIGWDYTQMGAYYLERNKLDKPLIAAVRWQCMPDQAERHAPMAGAIQIAQYLLHTADIDGLESIEEPEANSPEELPGWRILFGRNENNHAIVMASLKHSLNRLPMTLKGMI